MKRRAPSSPQPANIDNLRIDGGKPSVASCGITPTSIPIPTLTPTPLPSPTPVPGDLAVSVNINNDWGGGYCASLELTNNTGSDVTWNVSVSIEGIVSSLWNGEYTQSGSTLSISDISWNAVMSPGEADSSVGFCAK